MEEDPSAYMQAEGEKKKWRDWRATRGGAGRCTDLVARRVPGHEEVQLVAAELEEAALHVLLKARRRGLQAADPRPSHVHGRQVTAEPREIQAPDTQGWVLGGEVSTGGGELNAETRCGSVLE